ncbi:MAG TPA: NAD-dependent epimerase/dehydratase family protein [Anaerolineales bacterium]|nr:NAD-dependent epimerase/dehydratase family protein [Anaerolineales bacterium]
MSKYIVTGAAGFIANRVSQMLLADGHMVVGIDNLNDAYDVRMKEHRLGMLEGRDGFLFHPIDIADKQALDEIADDFQGAAGIINLAARAGVRASVENPWMYVDTNLTGTLNLLEVCRKFDIPKMVLASTSSVYGGDAPLPTPETAANNLPLQPYAASKFGAEAMAHAYHFLHNIDVTVVRYFTVYGPAGRPDMVMFRFGRWLVEGEPLHLNGDGTQSRGFTFVDDIARGTIQALRPLGYEIINLGGHESITINGLIELMEDITGKKGEITHHPFPKADMKANLADISKAQELLGWQPQVSLRDGVKRMMDWYMQNREWAKELDLGL